MPPPRLATVVVRGVALALTLATLPAAAQPSPAAAPTAKASDKAAAHAGDDDSDKAAAHASDDDSDKAAAHASDDDSDKAAAHASDDDSDKAAAHANDGGAAAASAAHAPAAVPADATAAPPTTTLEAQAAAQRQRREDTTPRPPPLAPPPVDEPPAWERHIEVGGEAALVVRPLASGPVPHDFSYDPAVGWGLHLAWEVLPWLRLRPYFLDAHHDVVIPAGALTTAAANSIGASAEVSEATAVTFMFGARIEPTLHIDDRFRVWLSAGVGWGRAVIAELTVVEAGGGTYTIGERSGVSVEFPLGLGAAFEVWPRWLVVEYQLSAAPLVGQSGTLYESVQAVDGNGKLRDVGPINPVGASIVQTLGLALML